VSPASTCLPLAVDGSLLLFGHPSIRTVDCFIIGGAKSFLENCWPGRSESSTRIVLVLLATPASSAGVSILPLAVVAVAAAVAAFVVVSPLKTTFFVATSHFPTIMMV
jgi:hypothetical protein